jgi:uncharacterized protein (DUF3084 family)
MFTNVTLVFFLLLIPLAGFIAWAGDRIGHKTGKKRQSLFGLRPRHTAMVFTIGSGMAIAFVSFGLFWALSESFRVIVRDGAALYQKNRWLKAENREQAVQISVAAHRVTSLHQDAERFAVERQKAEAALDVARNGLSQARARQAEAEARSKAAVANYQRAAAGRDVALKDLGQARRDLTLVQSDLKAKTERIRVAQERIQTAEQSVRIAENKVTVAEHEQKKAQAEADQAQKRALRVAQSAKEALDQQAATLNAKTDEISKRFSAQNTLYADLQYKTDLQNSELKRLTKKLEQKRAEYDQIVANADALRRRQITYQVGEEVDRVAIPAGRNVWRIEAILYSLLSTAAKKADVRGAARGSEERSVVILPRTVVASAGPTEAMTDKPVTEDEAVRAAADTIRRANEDVVVVASAVTNAVAGEPVAVDFQIHRNPIVLTEDVRVAEATVDGDSSRQEVADALYTFLSRDVHRKLIQAGMIPVSRGEGEGAVVEANRIADEFTLSGEEWLQIVDQVRRAGQGAKIMAYAAKDMRAGDPVTLRFEVKSRPAPPPPIP